MKMIWHDAVRKDSHRNPLTSQPNQLYKVSVITVLMEYLDLRVTTIDDVIADVAHRGSGCAWHTAIYLGPCSLDKRKEECPLLSTRRLNRKINFQPAEIQIAILAGAGLWCATRAGNREIAALADGGERAK